MDKNGKSNQDVRKVAPIRVVNLASLQNIKVVNKEAPTRQSRRKSVHQVRSNSDEQIEFIDESHTEVNNDDSSSSLATSSSNSTTFHKAPNAVRGIRTARRKGRETRPNENLMRRVALLRVCAEYMLKELQINNVTFGVNQPLEMLKAQYYNQDAAKKH